MWRGGRSAGMIALDILLLVLLVVVLVVVVVVVVVVASFSIALHVHGPLALHRAPAPLHARLGLYRNGGAARYDEPHHVVVDGGRKDHPQRQQPPSPPARPKDLIHLGVRLLLVRGVGRPVAGGLQAGDLRLVRRQRRRLS